jgi:acetyl esterase/lipase
MGLDAETQAFLDKSRLKPPPKGEIDLEEFRAAVEPFRELGFDLQDVGSVEDLEVPWEGEGQVAVRLYRPEGEGPLPVAVWAHGGSWVRVTVDTLDTTYRAMANASGCAIAAVDYRLSPESQFPQALNEMHAAARWLKAEARRFALDPRRIAIGGESSGGNVAAAVAMLDRDAGADGVGFALQALLLPVLDLGFDTPSWHELGKDYLLTAAQLEWALERYAPGGDRSDPLLSPAAATDLAGLPPALIVCGEYDPLRDEARRYAERLREAGVEVTLDVVPGLIHHAMMAPRLIPLGERTILATAGRIGAALGA